LVESGGGVLVFSGGDVFVGSGVSVGHSQGVLSRGGSGPADAVSVSLPASPRTRKNTPTNMRAAASKPRIRAVVGADDFIS
jgi:hypothetical protein